MADIKLFSLEEVVVELPSTSVTLEKELQTVIEKNMDTFFGVTFLKSEYSITNGRIDSLGLDENYSPVIFEYKRSTNENVINQGLYYLDWLLDHKADFQLLVMKVLGVEESNMIDWSYPCVICIASDFTRYDEHAVNQMQRNIKLVRYKKFGKDLILFEHLNAPKVIKSTIDFESVLSPSEKVTYSNYTFTERYNKADKIIQTLYLTIKDYILSLGDDVSDYQMKYYVAFKKTRNIACVRINKGRVYIGLSINPLSVELIEGFTKDMTNTGHYGTGDLQVVIKDLENFEKAKPLLDRAYNEG